MSGLRILYGDISPGAKEDFVASSSTSASVSHLSDFQEEQASIPDYGNPIELYSVPLDGSKTIIGEYANGWWSAIPSGNNKTFSTAQSVTFTADDTYSSDGITLVFGGTSIPTEINLKWYRGNTLLADHDYEPDNARYFCANRVDRFDKLIVTVTKMDMANNRARLNELVFGRGILIYRDEIKNGSIRQSISPLSTDLEIDTFDFSLYNEIEEEYYFQKRQTITVYFNDRLLCKTFVNNAKRTSRYDWRVQSEDYIGILDSAVYVGGWWNGDLRGTGTQAKVIIDEIAAASGVPISYDASVGNTLLSGTIPYCSCREALQQVAFAAGAYIKTAEEEDIHLYAISERQTSQTITLERIMQGQSFETETQVSSVELFHHKWELDVLNQDPIELFNADSGGTGEKMLILSEPYVQTAYSISGGSSYIIDSNCNYVHFVADTGCVLTGKPYVHTTLKYTATNPDAGADDNVVQIKDATLVTRFNVQAVLDNCKKELFKWTTCRSKIVDGYHEENGEEVEDQPTCVGDIVTVQSEYLAPFVGEILEQSYNVNGGILVKDSVVK